MRTALLALAAAVILAMPAAALALPDHDVLCGQSCGGVGGGFTGCADQQAAHSAKVSAVASISHFVVVHYCKLNGRITSLSIVAHGCDTNGLVACSTGPAWVSGGGVGASSATIEAHATWHVTPLPIYNGTDVVTLTIPTG
jgi:hypothetical protein